jgi:hypothetical protein
MEVFGAQVAAMKELSAGNDGLSNPPSPLLLEFCSLTILVEGVQFCDYAKGYVYFLFSREENIYFSLSTGEWFFVVQKPGVAG